MKHYIFLTLITGSGGVQCYVASKAKYLESVGWHVVVISDNKPKTKEKCPFDFLNKYLPNGNPYLQVHPNQIPNCLVKKGLQRFVDVIGPVSENDEAIIESWSSTSALWGELLASRLKCRHMFWTAHESYRDKGQLFENKIDFYKFKMDRGEIFTTIQSANRLFKGFREYKQGDFVENRITEAPIQDVYRPEVEIIKKKDWNICYIGRSTKPYVPNIFDGVAEFAAKHLDKSIQFIIVGDIGNQRGLLKKLNLDNLNIVELGDQYPLPRSLYKKTDVVIAGSGAARHSADEDALVIVADSETKSSHGLLGYDTNGSIYKSLSNSEGGLDLSFAEALERALVQKTWKLQVNCRKKSLSIEECTKIQFDIISKAAKDLVYYNEKRLLAGSIDFLLPLRIWKRRREKR